MLLIHQEGFSPKYVCLSADIGFDHHHPVLPNYFIDGLKETIEDLELSLILDSGDSLLRSASIMIAKINCI
jgi:hypothetical protein